MTDVIGEVRLALRAVRKAPAFALTDEEGGPTLTVPAQLAFDVNDY